jgi:periplasmic protein TonB
MPPSRHSAAARDSERISRRVGSGEHPRAALSMLDAPPRQSSPRAAAAGSVGSVAVHGGLLGLALMLGLNHPAPVQRQTAVTQMIDVALPPPPPPPAAVEPPPPPPPEEPPPPPLVKPRPVAKAAPPPPDEPAPPASEPPPPAAAETAKILDAAEPIDFGDKFVSGNASQFAGGVSAATGTSTKAVRDPRAQANGIAGGTGSGGPDLSRAATLADGLRWDIPFPFEADDAAIDHAQVTLRVSVAADGRVTSVTVVSDPGYGFGREAKRFAQTRRWQAARDRSGQPIATTSTVNVRFDR